MRKFFLIVFLCCLTGAAFAEFNRSTTFDDREICENDRGVWHQFPNDLADNCEDKLDEFAFAANEITYACDCGKGRCWNGAKCVFMKDYKKIYDAKKAIEDKKIAEAKKSRSQEYKDNSNVMLQSIIEKSASAQVNPSNKDSANNNLAQFYGNIPTNNSANQQIQNVVDQSKEAAKQVEQGPIGKVFVLPKDSSTTNNNEQNNAAQSDSNQLNSGPTPFFLQQQEKAKQNSASDSSTTSSANAENKNSNSTNSQLPQIPLPK
ncbi:MAG: hypothetical protein SFV53_07210 [Rickettsiales bacterium]|nr:hypothetical protein [Rickettsiales bacterium]